MKFSCPETDPPPVFLDELSPLEALLLSCFRRWVRGLCDRNPDHWQIAWNDLAGELGGEPARRAAASLNSLICKLCGGARRGLVTHPPCCRRVCGDELTVLSLVAACQNREIQRARGLAGWLVQEDGIDGLFCAAMGLASALMAEGRWLPRRGRQTERQGADLAGAAHRPALVH